MNEVETPAWTFRLSGGVVAWLVPLSLPLLIVSMTLYGAVHFSRLAQQTIPGGWAAWLGWIGIVLGVFIVHEALHGVGFRLFGGRPRFGAALASGMPFFYTACPGRRFTRGQYLVIGLLPLVAIDAAAFVLGAFAPLTGAGAVAVAVNTTGAVGDLWFAALLLQAPRGSHFEDGDGLSMVAWYPTDAANRLPRGLNPRGSRLGVIVVAALFVAGPLVMVAEVLLATALGGRLEVAGVELTAVGRTGNQMHARQNLSATLLLALVLTLFAVALVGAVRRRRRLRGRGLMRGA